MRLRIHRGAHEIGGSCVELEADGQSILLDLGLPLGATDAKPSLLPLIPGLMDGGNPNLLGIVLSHVHGDHNGLTGLLHSSIPVFMGAGAEALLRASQPFVRHAPQPQTIRKYESQVPFDLGPFRITPFLTDHSGFDAYIQVPEIQRLLRAESYKAAIKWLAERNLHSEFELAPGKWLFFDRQSVERKVEEEDRPRTVRLAEEERWIAEKGIDIAEAAGILHLRECTVATLATAGWLRRIKRWFDRDEVRMLAQRYIFIPEIRKRFFSKTTRRPDIIQWLKRRGITVAFNADHDRLTAFERSSVERLTERTSVKKPTNGLHAPATRHRLIRLVKGGMPVSQAAITVSVSRATADNWVSRWRREGKIPLSQKKRENVQSHIALLGRIVAKNPRLSIPEIIFALKKRVDVDVDYRGVRDVVVRNKIGWIGSARR